MAQETVTSYRYSTTNQTRGTGGYRKVQITKTEQKTDKRQNFVKISLKV